MKPEPPNPLTKSYTRRDAAKILGMSPEFVRDRLRDGSIEYLKYGRAVRIPEDELIRFVESCRRSGQLTSERRGRAAIENPPPASRRRATGSRS